MTISGQPSLTGWERVRKNIEDDAPIPYDPNDPDDDEAVEAFFKEATIWSGWPNPVLIQKDGVPVAADPAEPATKAS